MDKSLQTEIRPMIPNDDLIVLDMYCTATGKSRQEVVRELILVWSIKKRHEATLICRGAGINPNTSDNRRINDV